ncbi:ATP-dependent Clp protease adaptor ClpS [Chloroflexi bacterium CFX6]|nr:ATP-dependent Clp protease adaptor ClpS [Chloroflexi bacterium CFX6]
MAGHAAARHHHSHVCKSAAHPRKFRGGGDRNNFPMNKIHHFGFAQREPSAFIIHPSAVLPEIEIIEESETELEPLFKVVIHNDDVTPMDYVT